MSKALKRLRAGFFSGALFGLFISSLMGSLAQAESAFRDDAQIPSTAREALNSLLLQGVVKGNDDGTFAPQRQLNRAEVSKIVVLATKTPLAVAEGQHFPDVRPQDWFYPYIETMRAQGWIEGYPDGLFRPGQGIGRAELAKMLSNAFDLAPATDDQTSVTDLPAEAWFTPYVRSVLVAGVMPALSGNRFNPGGPVNRIDTVQFTYNAQRREQIPLVEAGTLQLNLSAQTPAATSVPKTAVRLPFLSFTARAQGSQNLVISRFVFERQGLGSRTQIDKVWLEDQTGPISQKRTLDSQERVEFILNPVITVPSSGFKTIMLYASLRDSTTTSGVGTTHRFVLRSVDQVGTSAQQITGTFPISGNTMTLVNYDTPKLSLSARGQGGVIQVGDRQKEIGAFSLENQSEKALNLSSIILENRGTTSFDEDLTNLNLVDGNRVQLARGTIVRPDRVRFDLTNVSIDKGARLNLSVLADAVRAQASSTILLRLNNAEDITATERTTGYAARIINNSGAVASNLAFKTYQVEAGKLTIAQEPYSVGNLSYAPGSRGVVLLNTRFTLTQPIRVDGVNVRLDSRTQVLTANGQSLSGSAALAELNRQLRSFTLYVNDKREATTAKLEGSSLADARLVFRDAIEIPSVANVRVTADLSPEAGLNTKVKFNLASGDLVSPEYLETGKAVSVSQLFGSVTGHFMTVEASQLKVVRSDGYSARVALVMGSSNLEMMRLVFDSNNVGEVNLSQLKFRILGSGNARPTGMTLRLLADGQALGKTRSVGNDNLVTFDGLNLVLGSGDGVSISVVADTASTTQTSLDQTLTTAGQAVANQSVTLSSVTGLNRGDQLRLTPRRATSSLGGLVPQNSVTGTISTFSGNTVTVTGANFAAPSTGSSGVTRLGVGDFTAITDMSTLRLVENENNQTLCSVLFREADLDTVTDYDCSDGQAQIPIPVGGYTDGVTWWSEFKQLSGVPGYILSVSDTQQTLTLSESSAPYVEGSLSVQGSASAAVAGAVLNEGQATQTLQVTLLSEMRLELIEVVAQNEAAGTLALVRNGAGNLISSSNPVSSAVLEVVQTGALSVQESSAQLYDQAIIPPGVVANVLGLRFNAVNESTLLRELWIINDANGDGQADPEPSGNVSIRLIDSTGRIIKERMMAGGAVTLSFSSQEAPRIDSRQSQTLWLQVLASKVGPNQAGVPLRLRLANQAANRGLVAQSASTGENLATPPSGWVVSSGGSNFYEYALHKSALSVRHAPNQPGAISPSNGLQEIYRVQAGARHGDLELARLSVQVDLQGMRRSGNVPLVAEDFRLYRLNNSGAPGNSPLGLISVDGSNASATQARLTIDLGNETLAQGQSVNYGLFLSQTEDSSGRSNDDSVAVTILRDSLSSGGLTLAEQKSAGARVIWSDLSASPHLSTTRDWFNGARIITDATAIINKSR